MAAPSDRRPLRPRRCQLCLPGSNRRMMTRAAGMAVDAVILDLEDAVAPDMKKQARATVVAGLRELDWGRKTRTVRINGLDTRYAYGDIIEIVTGARERIDTIMLPKVKSPADVLFADTLLRQIEADIGLDKPVGLELLIEEVEAIIHLDAIAAACPRVEAMTFGMGDYAASQGVQAGEVGGEASFYPGDLWHYQRHRLVIAARAAGIEAIDGPMADFSDLAMLQRQARQTMVLGFTGKWAIHPAQVPAIQSVYSPAPEAVDRARRLVAAYAQAEAAGAGAVTFEGVMIDIGSVRIARLLIDRAALLGL